MNELLALVGFGFVGSVSPGPNNVILWASGLRFGFRRTVPHVIGAAIGIATLILAAAAGIGAFLRAVPAAAVALKVVGSAYLLYLAYLVAGGGSVGRSDVSRPLTLLQGMMFQWVNPKAWVFAATAAGAFLPRALPWPVGAAILTGVLTLVVAVSFSVWAVGGAAIGRILDEERSRRMVAGGLAILLVASVVLLWI